MLHGAKLAPSQEPCHQLEAPPRAFCPFRCTSPEQHEAARRFVRPRRSSTDGPSCSSPTRWSIAARTGRIPPVVVRFNSPAVSMICCRW
jgi:hypothetical protein